MIIPSYSEDDTKNVGFMLADNAKKGDIFCLVGDISAGKTHLTKGFASGLMIEDEIVSPTFTIVNSYDSGKLLFHHFDVYRLENPNELENIGFDDYIYGDGVCLIEWADMIEEYIPKDAIWINLSKDDAKGDNYRKIEINE